MKQLMSILSPGMKPFNDWNGEDKRTALYLVLIVLLFIIGGWIDKGL